MTVSSRTARQRVVVMATALALAGTMGLASAATDILRADGPGRTFRSCPVGIEAMDLGGDRPVSCAHTDIAPPGVDVTKPVSTAALLQRQGDAPAAAAAAELAGLPVSSAVAAPSRNVACDGDGASGYRVQAMYVYDPAPTGSTGGDRYDQVKESIQTWAAGVDTAFQLSAALTGGARKVRWVTEPDGVGGCVPSVVKLSSTSMRTNGLANLAGDAAAAGYNRADRKYLMWADASVLCGIGDLYGSASQGGRYASPNQDNWNNGYYAQYSRVDTGCWGWSGTEAHELTHNLGAVLDNAPHKSAAGHCTDESDIMCYSDGTGVQMVDTCPPENEALLDCNGDDYFNTFPKPGTYLASTWNTANSRFLIGGGNGTTGGTSGTNRAEVVANPGLSGLPTQASATATVPAGRTYTTAFTSRTTGCLTDTNAGNQGLIRCRPGVASGSLTATVTDSTGVRSQASTLVPFDQTPRSATLSAPSTVTGCAPGYLTLSAALVDQATGVGVYGARVNFTQAAKVIGSADTDATGKAQAQIYVPAGTPITVTAADSTYAATPSATTTVTAACPVSNATAVAQRTDIYYGQDLVVTGTVYDVNGTVPSRDVTVKLGPVSANATTNSTGNYTATLRSVTAGGTVTVTPAGVTQSFGGSTVRVSPYQSFLTVTGGVGERGQPGQVNGTLVRYDPVTGASVPMSGVPVRVSGSGWSLTSAPTNADGVYSVATPPLSTSQSVTASVTGRADIEDATASDYINVFTHDVSLALSGPAEAQAGTDVQVTGMLTLTDGLSYPDPAGRTVRLSVTSAGTTRTMNVTVEGGGFFQTTLPALTADTTVVAHVDAVSPWPAADSDPLPIHVLQATMTSAIALEQAPATVTYGSSPTVSGRLTVRDDLGSLVNTAGAPVVVAYGPAGTTPKTVTVTAGTNGVFTATLPNLTATSDVVARYAGNGTWPAAASVPATVTVTAPVYTTATAITSAPTSVLYGAKATIRGTLKVTASAGPVPVVSGSTVRVVITPYGSVPTTVLATVDAAGGWSVTTAALTKSTTVAAVFDKSGSWPSSATASKVVAVTNYGAYPSVTAPTKLTGSGTITVSGYAYKGSGTSRWVLPKAKVTAAAYDAYGKYRAGVTVYADSYGKYTARVPVSFSGTIRVTQAATTGVSAGTASRAITVVLRPAISLSTRTPRYGTTFTAYASTSPARSGRAASLQRYYGGKWSTIATVTTDRYGKGRVSVRASAKGTISYRWYVSGDKYNVGGYSSALSTSVR